MEDVKRGRVILIAVMACAVLAGIAVAVWPREKEPDYQGKKLSEWVISCYRAGPVTDEARDAIRHIGTNALPWLLEWTDYDLPRWYVHTYRFAVGVAPRASARVVAGWLWSTQDKRNARAEGSVRAFEVLGAEAAPALPELARRMNCRGRADPGTERALRASVWIGDKGHSAVLDLLRDGGDSARFGAANMVIALHRARGGDISRALPWVLVLNMASRVNPFGPQVNFDNLSGDDDPELLPALTKCLQHPNHCVRAEAVRMIGLMGRRGLDGLPGVQAGLMDEDLLVRQESTNALLKIAPDVLEKAPKGKAENLKQ